MNIITDAFNDIERNELSSKEGLAGSDYLDDISAMQIGIGSKVFRADASGIWLGASKFVDAPFSVDMEGNISATSLDLTGYLSKTGTAQNLTGDIQVGVSGVKIDGANKRIVINDGTNDRILIGYQSGGF